MRVSIDLTFDVVDEGRLRDQARLIYSIIDVEPELSETLSLEEVITDVIVNYDVISLYQQKTVSWLDLGLERVSR